MRKNRSFLRKTLVEPIIEKRQEQLAAKLNKTLEAKQQPTTLMNLKKLLPTSQKDDTSKDKEGEDGADEEMDDDDEEEEEEQPKETKKKSKKANPFQKPKAVKAAKANKPQKEMVWFK
jgi:hypothetical protein